MITSRLKWNKSNIQLQVWTCEEGQLKIWSSLKISYDGTTLFVSAVYGEPGSVKMVLQKKLERIWSCRAQREDSLCLDSSTIQKIECWTVLGWNQFAEPNHTPWLLFIQFECARSHTEQRWGCSKRCVDRQIEKYNTKPVLVLVRNSVEPYSITTYGSCLEDPCSISSKFFTSTTESHDKTDTRESLADYAMTIHHEILA